MDQEVAKTAKTQVDIVGNVLGTCGVTHDRAYFDIDSTELDWREHAMLKQVAECMQSGSLAGHSLMVTGYADETGPRNYNQELALARGRAVAHELERLGVPSNRLYVRTLGESRVVFQGRKDKDYDRRVELSIVQRDS